MHLPRRTAMFLRAVRTRRKAWENLCVKCGICCCDRTLSSSGELVVELSSPCEYLDPESRLCRVYSERFRVCSECRKVNLFHALFSRYLPPSCGYVRKFRFWRKAGRSALRSGGPSQQASRDFS